MNWRMLAPSMCKWKEPKGWMGGLLLLDREDTVNHPDDSLAYYELVGRSWV